MSNQYLINNIKDFLWLTNENCNTANMQNAFMQLNADLVFNDEIFDKDGNPTGGDGVVYSWKSVKAGWASSLDGNNFSMKGYYVVDGASSNSVFSDTREVVQNIVFENFCIKGENGVLISRVNSKVENIIVRKGMIDAGTYHGIAECSFAYNCINYVDIRANAGGACAITPNVNVAFNCKNYGDITANGKAGMFDSFFSKENCIISNCINYGNIKSTGTGTNPGGVVAVDVGGSKGKITNCKNFGKIEGALIRFVGGIVGNNYETLIENCINYGAVVSGSSAGGIVGGGMNCIIENCENYGDIDGGGAFYGGKENNFSTYISILNCKNYGDLINCKGIFIGSCEKTNNTTVVNCANYGNVISWSTSWWAGMLIGRTEANSATLPSTVVFKSNILKCKILDGTNKKSDFFGDIKYGQFVFENNIIDIDCEQSYGYTYFIYRSVDLGEEIVLRNNIIDFKSPKLGLAICHAIKGDATFENIIINQQTGELVLNYIPTSENFNYDGIIIVDKNNIEPRKLYFGENFTEYYYSWKTGEIGLKALNSNGVFQGDVTEDYLIYKDYTKVE